MLKGEKKHNKAKIIGIIVVALIVLGVIGIPTSPQIAHASSVPAPSSPTTAKDNSQSNDSGIESNFNSELILASQTVVRKKLLVTSNLTFPNEFESKNWSIINYAKNKNKYLVNGSVKDNTNNTSYNYAVTLTLSDNNQHYTGVLNQLFATS